MTCIVWQYKYTGWKNIQLECTHELHYKQRAVLRGTQRAQQCEENQNFSIQSTSPGKFHSWVGRTPSFYMPFPRELHFRLLPPAERMLEKETLRAVAMVTVGHKGDLAEDGKEWEVLQDGPQTVPEVLTKGYPSTFFICSHWQNCSIPAAADECNLYWCIVSNWLVGIKSWRTHWPLVFHEYLAPTA